MNKIYIFLLLTVLKINLFGQGSCTSPFSLCDSISFPATVAYSSGSGNSYGCITNVVNPAWIYTQITSSGQIKYNVSNSSGADIDVICWGPFQDMSNVCSQTTFSPNLNIVDCSYSTNASEFITINNALVGQYYFFMVTNYGNMSTDITFQKLPSSGEACSTSKGISGFLYNDVNTNCTLDLNTDVLTKNIPIRLYDTLTNLISTTYQSNSLSTPLPYKLYADSGKYIVKIDTTNKPYQVQCSSPGIDTLVILNSNHPLDTNIHFSIEPKPGFDIGVHAINQMGIVFPGQIHLVNIITGDLLKLYNLTSANGISGQIKVDISGPISYNTNSSGTMIPNIINGNSLTYYISDFGALNLYNNIGFSVLTHTNAQAGQNVCISVSVTPTINDNDISNNNKTYCYQVVNSYDPNIKVTYPRIVEPNYEDWFYYTIYFRNTGNAPAININLTDSLSNLYNYATLERIHYSHENSFNFKNGVLKIDFKNIYLPDSASSGDASIGYVQYRIKPKPNLPNGTIIKNRAFIYFDYNAPIITNTSQNLFFSETTSLKENYKNDIIVYPNPTNGLITVSSNQPFKLNIFNLLGEEVYFNEFKNDSYQVDLSNLNNVIYLMKLDLENSKTETRRLIIQK